MFFFSTSGTHRFLDGYCSAVQGLLNWFKVDLGFTKLCVFRLICVPCDFMISSFVSSLSFCSSLVLFGRLALPPPRGVSVSRVSPQSCQAHMSLWGLCCTLSKDHLFYFLHDRADDSSIHRGTYHLQGHPGTHHSRNSGWQIETAVWNLAGLAGFFHCALETRWQRFGQFLGAFLNDFLYDFLHENLIFRFSWWLNFLYENLRFSVWKSLIFSRNSRIP